MAPLETGHKSSSPHSYQSSTFEVVLWAALFDFWLILIAAAGTSFVVIGLASGTAFATAGILANFIPIVGQIVSGVIAVIGGASNITIAIIGFGISFFASLVSAALSLIYNGLLKRHGIHALGKSIAMRVIFMSVGRIIPGINLLPFFTIFTAIAFMGKGQRDTE